VSGRIIGTLAVLALFCGLSVAALAQKGAGGDIPAGPQDPFKAKSGSKTNRACTREPEAPKKKKIVVEIDDRWLDDIELFERNVSALISPHKISDVDWKVPGLYYKTSQIIKKVSYNRGIRLAFYLIDYHNRIMRGSFVPLASKNTFRDTVKAEREKQAQKLRKHPQDPAVIDAYCRQMAEINLEIEFRAHLFEQLSEGLPADGEGICLYEEAVIKRIGTLPSPEAKHIAKLLRDGLPDHLLTADRIRFVATIRIPQTPGVPPEAKVLPGFEKKVAEWQKQVREIRPLLKGLQEFYRQHWTEIKQRAALRAERKKRSR
jgi:hypothetical protein